MITNDESNSNLIVKSLGKAMKTEVKFVTIIYILSDQKNHLNELESVQLVLLLGRENIFILTSDFVSVKLNLRYDKIKDLLLDPENKNCLQLRFLSTVDQLTQKPIESFMFFLKERKQFVKSLVCYHSIYHMAQLGKVTEISIKQKVINTTKQKIPILSKGKKLNHNLPDGFVKRRIAEYEYFLKDAVESEYEKILSINTRKNCESRLMINVY